MQFHPITIGTALQIRCSLHFSCSLAHNFESICEYRESYHIAWCLFISTSPGLFYALSIAIEHYFVVAVFLISNELIVRLTPRMRKECSDLWDFIRIMCMLSLTRKIWLNDIWWNFFFVKSILLLLRLRIIYMPGLRYDVYK